MMRKIFTIVLSLLLLIVPQVVQSQEELTVYEGTTTNNYVPAYVYYFDGFTKSQFVIPAADLEEMTNSTITGVKFYTNSDNIPYTSVSDVVVYFMEVDYTSINAYEPRANGTLVYQGVLGFVSEGDGGSLTIEFSTPYTYTGGNLLVGIENITNNGWKNMKFFGTTVNGASIAGNSSSLDGVPATQRNFIPKTTFTYIPAGGVVCEKPATFVVNDVTAHTAVLTWNGSSSIYNVEYKKVGSADWSVYANGISDTTLTMVNLMHATDYQVRVQSVCADGVSGWKSVLFSTDLVNYDRVYVTENGTGDGGSWATATSDLNWALTTASMIKNVYGAAPDVWVAAGIYYGDTTAENAFTMVDGVNVYGGFAGNEPADYNLSLRDFEVNETILDGQNARRVLYQSSSFNVLTTWDGFTVRNGHTTGSVNGGGAYLNSRGQLSHCVITNNTAYNGGGVCAYYASLSNCVITHNNARNNGGGVCAYYSSTNVANCLISNNTANSYGGGVYNDQAIITNSTVVRNTSNYGSGIYGPSSGGILINSIVWGNGEDEPDNILGDISCSYSAIEGVCAGESNIVLNDVIHQTPQFVKPSLMSGTSDTTTTVDWHLQDGSVCINHGNNEAVMDSVDLDGTVRVKRDTVDLGCYESDYYSIPIVIPIVYVTENGAGTQTGDSWENAMASIQDAMVLAHTQSGMVWVAAGTYYGNATSSSAFTMINGVNVYGGFAGNEPADYDLSLRNFEANVTILDGQNARRVVEQPSSFNILTTWDGFTIQNGYVTGYNGGGACLRSKGKISHCVIKHNLAYNGGGVYAVLATISNCLISNNTASKYGGGVYASSSIITNSTIVRNMGSDGSGIWSSSSGGSLTNSIVWGNGADESINISGSITCSYSAVEGGFTGNHNILLSDSLQQTPLFVHPSLTSGVSDTTSDVNWHLQQGSVCINHGNNMSVTDSADLDGTSRIKRDTVDLGCYESDYYSVRPKIPIVYVTENGAGAKTGDSWANAMSSIQDAMALAQTRFGIVWVAAGIYYGETDSTSENAFTMVEGVDVYGGFAGNEPVDYDLSLRNFDVNATILDGQDTRRVLYQPANFSVETIWDGFTIQNGFVDGDGSGAYLQGNAMLRNSIVQNNRTSYSYYKRGGGVYANGASQSSKVKIIHCIVRNNYSSYPGGGAYLRNAIIEQSVIMYNRSLGSGGGLYAYNNVLINNCLVANNTSDDYYGSNGGGVFAYSDNISILNTTIVRNLSTSSGAGIYSSSNSTTLTNSIVWGNMKNEMLNNVGGSLSCSYSAIEGYCNGDNVIVLSEANPPLFVNPSSIAGISDTTNNVDWHLQEGSLCINRGDNNAVMSGLDLDDMLRIRQDTVDLGCYESNCFSTPYSEIEYSNIVYVTPSGAGRKTGENWANACSSISSAVSTSIIYGISQVWVAAGIYYGDTTAENAFTMVDGVNVYGGFAGNEPADYELSLRDFKTNETILDGQNARRVLNQPRAFNRETEWDGFTIQNGNVNGLGGGAILSANGKLSYCNIKNNTAHSGGGIWAYGTNSVNKSIISHCQIMNNYSNDPHNGQGGGVYLSYSSIRNCLVSNNSCNGYSGKGVGVYSYSSEIQNSTIVHNGDDVFSRASGIYGLGNTTITNCIIWGNSIDVYSGDLICSYTAIENGYAGDGNITLNTMNPPLFVHPSFTTGVYDTTSNVDWRLREGSPCINKGDNSVVVDSLDLEGTLRIKRDTVDLGCFESDYYHSDGVGIQNVIYVTQTGAGDQSGNSWGNAMSSIENAQISAMNVGAVVWVAAGTYYGDTSSANAFTMHDGVCVYGGFEGNEPADYDLALRNFEINTTILDGADERRVLYQPSSFNGITIWDGFTIQNGHAVGTGTSGGGAYLSNNGKLCHCVVKNNIAYYGGGIYLGNNSMLSNCILSKNSANEGGGVYAGSNSNVSNCLISNNTGGGVYNDMATITNSTIVRNLRYSGAGIYCPSEGNVVNSLVWGNGSNETDNIYGNVSCSYSAVEGGHEGNNNVLLNSNNPPLFVNPSAIAGVEDSTSNVDWHLQIGSPCINRGDNTAVTDSLDLDGTARVKRDTVDLGCYESDFYNGTESNNYGSVVYVTPTGAGNYSGDSWANATSSIEEAQAIALTHGAVVWVAAGTYYGDTIGYNAFTMREGVNVYGGFAGDEPDTFDLSQRDLENHVSILDGMNTHRVLNQPNYFNILTTWDGFTIRNGEVYVYGGGCYLQKNGAISRCIITHNQATNELFGGGVYSDGAIVINCLVANNSGGGVCSRGNTQIINSTIVRNRGGGLISAHSYGDNLMKNCIVWGNEPYNILLDNDEINCTYSAIGYGFPGDHNIPLVEGDSVFQPFFVNPSVVAGINDSTENVDWRLSQNSICINKGDNLVVIDSFDIAGNIRVQNDTVDIGCYESNYYGVTTKSTNYGNIVYVTLQGSGTEMGDSWENATSSFPFALSMAKTKEASVWVAAGIYYGDTIASSESAFTMQEGVNVYGGFAGNEPADYNLSSRDFVSNETILDGDSARRVLFQPYHFNLETTWDGFTIRNGVANAHDVNHWNDKNNGGGAYLRRAGMLNNCVIKNNQSNRYGGGIYALDKFVIRNCQLLYNAAWTGGGGLCVYGNYDTIEISNCLIANNAHGGIHMTTYKSSSINNSTIVRNSQAVNADSQTAYLKNCIVWGNASNFSGSINCSYSAIEGGYEGDSNITLNAEHLPLFVNPSQTAGADDPSASVDWHLLLGSPCINAGDNSAVTDSVDLDGTARIKRGTVDLGCYESDYDNESYLGVVYVTVTGAGMQTGDSWANAISSIETAQNIASNVGAVVWVASGTYYGDTTANNAFTMHDGVSVFGGFVGNEPASYDLSLRDFETNATILDGQNLRRVLYQPNNFNDTTKWEGFTIQNGRTSGYEKGAGAYLQRRGQLSHCRIQGNISMNSHGGGIYCENTSVNNCDIIGNTCCASGGGVYALNSEVSGCIIEDNLTTCKYYNGGGGICSSSSTIFECQIRGNTSAYYGGGVYSVDNSTVRDCHIVDNTSDYGGGVYASSGIIVSCQISHNKSSFTGGGITSTSLSTQIRNCLVDNNTAGKTSSHYGGGIYGSSTVMNSTIVRNRSAGDGAGVFGNSSIILQNCIIWGNMRNGSTNSLSGSSVTCSYSAVEGGYDGDNVITLTAGNPPLFANPSLTAGADDSTANVDWHLQNGSVCVNRGDNIFVTDSLDLDGATRIKRDIVDLGCYESDYNSAGDLLSHVYVTAGGAGAQTGDSWENAVATIGEALQLAQANNSDVWVAAGTYYGDTTAANAFMMVEGVNVYGGFVGDEPADYDLSLRNFEANATILDGQDVRRVLYQPATFNVFTIWDGFTIQNGHTTGTGNGGGAYLRNRGKISNCVIKHNSAHYGGGVYASSAIISHCLISGNTAVYGGGVSTNNSTTNVTNCLISNNTASNSGGGVYNNGANITSSTIVRNIANNGTGVYGYSGGNLANSIVWGNGEDMTKNISGSVTCSFSAVEGGFSGNQNIMLSDYILQTPRFVRPSFSSGASDTTSNVDWHLQQGSVCINRGNNSETTTSLDLDGTARIKRDTVDLGCYESDYYSVPVTEYNGIIYVTQNGAGTHTGDSWENAISSIEEAQGLAQIHNAVVWVAAGTYYGDTLSDNAFTMVEGVNVYGGFAGNEPADYDLSQRDFETDATILDGQNSRRVLNQPSEFNNSTTWDGFTIQNGQISGSGAGAFLRKKGCLSHCVVRNNTSIEGWGGGVYCNDGSTATNCQISDNTSYATVLAYGGGIYASYATVSNCKIKNNYANSSAANGGGVYSSVSTITNCVISHNRSAVYGGGMYAYASTVSNCLFSNNHSNYDGGGVYAEQTAVVGSSIVRNTSGRYGPGIFGTSNVSWIPATLSNSIVWGNERGGVSDNVGGSFTCSHSAIEGGCSGNSIITLSAENPPLFVNPSLTAGANDSTANVDWHLQQGSPCINAGDNSAVTDSLDLDGTARIKRDTVDLGCYESDYYSVPVYYCTTVYSEFSDTTCDTYIWNDQTYSQSGNYTQSFELPNGCDSVVTLHLTVNHSVTTNDYLTICENELPYTYGDTVFEVGTPIIVNYQLSTTNGCDSIVTLHLTVLPSTVGEFLAMTPTNNYPISNYPIHFTWDAVENASDYDLYVWPVGESQPQEPTASHIHGTQYAMANLPNHHDYQWFMKAYNACDTSTSTVRHFSLNVAPALTVTAGNPVDFGEVPLNSTRNVYFQVHGTALDSVISYQISGADASSFALSPSSSWDSLAGGGMQLTFHPTVPQNEYTAQMTFQSDSLVKTITVKGYLSDYLTFITYVDTNVYAMDSEIPIHGRVTNPLNEPVAGLEVEVYVSVMDYVRTLPATSDANGQFTVMFTPQHSEAGYYTVGSRRAGGNSTAVHDDFNIPGMMRVSSDWILWEPTIDQPDTGVIAVRNRSQIPLTNIQVTPLSLPNGCTVQFIPLNLAGMATGNLQYIVSGSELSTGVNYEEVRLNALSYEGAAMSFSAWYYCIPQRADLDVTPTSLITTMTRGKSKVVDFKIYNNGTGPTGNIYVSLPDMPWMSVVGSDTLPSLAVHDSAYVSVRLSADSTTDLVRYTGHIAINCERGESVSIPYDITAISDSTGTLLVDVTDEYTWNTNNGHGPHLAGAKVIVRGYYSLETVATGVTDANGLFEVNNLPEGWYKLIVRADRHAEYQGNLLITAGDTNRQDIFIQFQAITYSWEVVPTEIEDQYTYELNVEFETHVPKPAVVMEIDRELTLLEECETAEFNVIATNHGLVAAMDFSIIVPQSDYFVFTPLISHIDSFPAQTTYIIPVTYRRKDCAELGYLINESSQHLPNNTSNLDNSAGDDFGNGFVYNSANGETDPLCYYCGIKCEKKVFSSTYYYVCRISYWETVVSTEVHYVDAPQSDCEEDSRDEIEKIIAVAAPNVFTMRPFWSGIVDWLMQGGGMPELIEICDPNLTPCQNALNGVLGCIPYISMTVNPETNEIDIPIVETISKATLQASKKILEYMATTTAATAFSTAFEIAIASGATVYDAIAAGEAAIPALSFVGDVTAQFLDIASRVECFDKGFATNLPNITTCLRSLVDVPGHYTASEIRDRDLATFMYIYKSLLPIIYMQFNVNPYVYNIILEKMPNVMSQASAVSGGHFNQSALLSSKNDIIYEGQILQTGRAEILAECFEIDESPEVEEVVNLLVDRWNHSIEAWNKGYFTAADAPAGYDTNFIQIDTNLIREFYELNEEAISQGYTNIFERYSESVIALQNAVEEYQNNLNTSSLCASVTVQFSQTMTMTREAFEGTLTINNGHESEPMQDIDVNFVIRDENGVDCTNLFQINFLSYNNMAGANGNASLDAQNTGSIVVQFIPTKQAAPEIAKRYAFGGSFSFIDPFTGESMTYSLYPVDIMVHPSPDLYVNYFMQRDILGDDPLTENRVEPIIPAELGVIIHNRGAGIAKNVLLETAEPRIIDNDKGLAVDFAMYGAAFNGQERQLGLMEIPFGNIEPNHTGVGEWWFTSTLLGHFVSYEAHVIHNNSFGNPDLSLVSSLDIHPLIHTVYAYGNLDDGINDFLVDDVEDSQNYPDSLYFSNGSRTGVATADSIGFDHYVTPTDTIVILTLDPSRIGWNYEQTWDPGRGQYKLISCTRNSDQQEIPLSNVWQSFVTLPVGADPVYENRLHIVDTLNNDLPTTYTLVFSLQETVLEVDTILNMPDSIITTPLSEVTVVFNKPIVDSTFNYLDMSLKCNNGANLLDENLNVEKMDSMTYKLHLGNYTQQSGLFVLNIQTLNITDVYGFNGYYGKQATWIQVITTCQPDSVSFSDIACNSYTWGGVTYTQSGDYMHTFTNSAGCDSVVTLHLTINHSVSELVEATACDSYTWNDSVYTQSGDYLQTFTAANGCDSVVTLHLTVNYSNTGDTTAIACDSYDWYGTTYTSSGDYSYTLTNVAGCDSVVTLHLTVNYSNTGDTTAIACDNFNWYGTTYTSSGDYSYTLTNAAGCDSIVTLHLTVNYSNTGDTTAIACNSFDWYGATYTTSGNYPHTLTNASGCDSVVTLHLTVNYSNTGDTTAVACDSFDWYGITYTSSGNYTHTLTNAAGCDSVVTLHLNVNYSNTGDTTAVACDNFNWYGTTYTSSGDYLHTLTNASGCDSVVTLHLTVNHSNTGDTTAVVCDSFNWYGTTYMSSGDYTHTLMNVSSCDSVVTLHLTVHHPVAEVVEATACESYMWNGTTYTQSGTYSYSHLDANGCTQVDTLHLTVNHPVAELVEATACESYTWNGTTYTQSGTYTYSHLDANGCTQVDTLHLTVNHPVAELVEVTACESYTWNGTTYTQSGTYTYSHLDANGCTQVDTLYLTVNHPVAESVEVNACESYTWNGTTYTQSGTYTYSHLDVNGCTQVDTLHLTVNHPVAEHVEVTACESYTWNGTTYTQSGTYIYSHLDANGCTQVDTLQLTVNHPVAELVEVTACESYTWNGTTYTQSGTYTFSHLDANGCTQVDTLHLTVNHPVGELVEVTACESYTWNGTTYTQSGTYTYSHLDANGCTQVDTLLLTVNYPVSESVEATACESYTWNGTTYTQSGTYAKTFTAANGCDSVVTLHLTLIEMPVLQAITGEQEICINQYATYHYDISDPNYQYRWLKDNVLWAENLPVMTLHEMGESIVAVTMQVADGQTGCAADTSLYVQVLNRIAPDTTEIRRKVNTNILICQPVYSDYGQVHYRWGYTDLNTTAEVIVPGDRNYCLYEFGIDTLSYRYWVETYLNEAVGVGCENRSYYAYGYITTSTPDYGGNVVEAYLSNDRIVLYVNSLSLENIMTSLYDVNGKLLLSKGYGTTDQVSDVIPVSIAPGVYFLRVSIGGQMYSVKLLKI